MKQLPTNEDIGNVVYQHAIEIAKQIFNSRLLGCYALGSLAHGGFAPLVSDVDLAIILEDPLQKDDVDKIELIKNDVIKMALPLGDRLSIFWSSPATLINNDEAGRFPPLDKLDLIIHGKLLMGNDIRSSIPKPTQSELLIMGVVYALDNLQSPEICLEIITPSLLYKQGVRHLTKIILFPVRFLYTSLTGKIGRNQEAVDHYLTHNHGKKAKLVEAAFSWRHKEPENEHEVTQLADGVLSTLYIQFINEYHEKMLGYHETEIANKLVKWKETLTAK